MVMVPNTLEDLVVLRKLTDGSIRVEIHAEMCDQGCGERVVYWNDASGGNASCGCCHEGPEACDEIMMFPQVHNVLQDAIAQIIAERRAKIERETERRAKIERETGKGRTP